MDIIEKALAEIAADQAEAERRWAAAPVPSWLHRGEEAVFLEAARLSWGKAVGISAPSESSTPVVAKGIPIDFKTHIGTGLTASGKASADPGMGQAAVSGVTVSKRIGPLTVRIWSQEGGVAIGRSKAVAEAAAIVAAELDLTHPLEKRPMSDHPDHRRFNDLEVLGAVRVGSDNGRTYLDVKMPDGRRAAVVFPSSVSAKRVVESAAKGRIDVLGSILDNPLGVSMADIRATMAIASEDRGKEEPAPQVSGPDCGPKTMLDKEEGLDVGGRTASDSMPTMAIVSNYDFLAAESEPGVRTAPDGRSYIPCLASVRPEGNGWRVSVEGIPDDGRGIDAGYADRIVPMESGVFDTKGLNDLSRHLGVDLREHHVLAEVKAAFARAVSEDGAFGSPSRWGDRLDAEVTRFANAGESSDARDMFLHIVGLSGQSIRDADLSEVARRAPKLLLAAGEESFAKIAAAISPVLESQILRSGQAAEPVGKAPRRSDRNDRSL